MTDKDQDPEPLSMPGLLLDMPARDITAAKAFYRDVLGWVFTRPDVEYPEFGDGTFTGFLFESEGSEAWPLVVVRVRDIEEVLRRVEAHGGTITTRRSMPGAETAIIHDPSGNRLGFWQEGEHGPEI